MKLEDYVNREKILALLIRYRVKIAHNKHKNHLVTGITYNKKFIEKFHESAVGFEKEVLEMMPPRRQWTKLDLKARKERTDSISRNIRSLQITIKQKSLKNEKYLWLENQNKFIDNLIEKVLSGRYQLSKAEVNPLIKDKKNGVITYRPIAVYNLEDRIIISLVAKYLTDCFDWVFRETSCAYAFRSVLKQKPITHHDAIQKIQNYISSRNGQQIFVAESDIRKFFDCVNHELAKESLSDLIEQTNKISAVPISGIASQIFEQYLQSYNFKRDVFDKNEDKDWFLNQNRQPGKFKWEEDDLKKYFYNDGLPEGIGVPQGGAISCLISNTLLNKVDQLILQSSEFKNDSELLYLRYCDDMIIMHTDYSKCQNALELYNKGLTECKLLYHSYKQPADGFVYNHKTYDAKAKPIYKLANKTDTFSPSIPWVAFVGYQIRHDGLIRVRRKSIEKEKLKQKKERMRVKNSFGLMKKPHVSIKNMRKPIESIAYRLEQRYISMAVGRIKLHELKVGEGDDTKSQGLCWTNGFKQLDRNTIAINQLKELDRSRRNNMIKLIRHLTYLNSGKKVTVPKKDDGAKKKKMDFSLKNGHPFSYHYYLGSRKI